MSAVGEATSRSFANAQNVDLQGSLIQRRVRPSQSHSKMLMPDQHIGSAQGLAIFLRRPRPSLTDAPPIRQQPKIGRAPSPKNSRSVYNSQRKGWRSTKPVPHARTSAISGRAGWYCFVSRCEPIQFSALRSPYATLACRPFYVNLPAEDRWSLVNFLVSDPRSVSASAMMRSSRDCGTEARDRVEYQCRRT